jgi:hypothetical protein
MARFAIERVVTVADRGLSLHNPEELQAMRLPNSKPLEFILAVPERRYGTLPIYLIPSISRRLPVAKKRLLVSSSYRGCGWW